MTTAHATGCNSSIFLRVSRFFLLSALLMLPLCHTTLAADRRHVTEPVLPGAICATLTPPADNLQTALDHCHRGGTVRVTAGYYQSGPLRIPDGISLWLDKGSMLAASRNPRVYDRGQQRCGTLDAQGEGCRPFILITGTGSSIAGDGIIDGQGGQTMTGSSESWWALARRAQTTGLKQNVPRLIEADHARDITVYRVRLRNAPGFHLVIKQSTGVTVWGITIDTPASARNTDGIDPISSSDVTVAHNFIRTGDDNIAVKAGSGGPARYLSILSNHLYAGHGMSVGSETQGGVSDVLIKDLTLDGTTSGLRIKSDPSRGGQVARIDYQNICLRHSRRPIDIDTRYDIHARGDAIPVYQAIRLQQVSGEDGKLVIKGYNAQHPVSVSLDGVRFSASAQWQVENAQIHIGQDGVSPAPPGMQASRSAQAPQCNWDPFPETGRP